MENKENTELTVVEELKQSDDALISEIVKETDADRLKDLTHLFNLFQTKRHILRVNTLNDVQDALVHQMLDRLAQQPHNFNNSDIAAWMKTVQQAIESSQKSIEQVDSVPTIVTQNNNTQNVNISIVDSLDRDSRERILEVLNIILPNIEEQTRIVNILDKFENLVNILDEGIPAEIELRKKQYEYYRNKLLDFRGL